MDMCMHSLGKTGIGQHACSLPRFVDLKQIDGQIFLQQRWVYSETAENCNSRSVNMVCRVQVPTWPWKGTWQGGKGNWEGCSQQRVHGFSLAPCWERWGVFLFPFGLCYHPRGESFPFSSPTLFNWGFCLFFYRLKEVKFCFLVLGLKL